MQKNLAHASPLRTHWIAASPLATSCCCSGVGKNPVPVTHPVGMLDYAGERTLPPMCFRIAATPGSKPRTGFRIGSGASTPTAWDDIRFNHVLPYREARDSGMKSTFIRYSLT